MALADLAQLLVTFSVEVVSDFLVAARGERVVNFGWASGGFGTCRFGAAAGSWFGRGGLILAGRAAVSALLLVPVSMTFGPAWDTYCMVQTKLYLTGNYLVI